MKVKNLNSHVEHMTAGYRQQINYYQQLLQLARQQADLISAADWGRLEQLLRTKQDLINIIREIDKEIDLHSDAAAAILHLDRFEPKKDHDLVYPQNGQALKEATGTITSLIREISQIEQDSGAAVKQRMKDVSLELKEIQQHFEIQQTYLDRPERFPEPHLFDQKK